MTVENLGIVIAVSEYPVSTDNLPACARDGQAIAKLLELESRFSDVLFVESDTKSSIVKSKVIDFINRHKGKEIGDFVFYFTGHGDFVGDEFYYLLSDYDAKRRKQTSIENSELDDLVRNLSPNLFVKIVDACHSGIAYIKSSEDFREYLKATGTSKFKKLYFMFSSQSEQFSYQDSHLSHFTRQIIEAIASHSAPSVRYKDIIDFVSDAFEGDPTQTPFFVTQADFTETFCDISSTLKSGVSQFLSLPAPKPLPSASGKAAPSLIELIEKDAELYCTEEEALRAVAFVSERLGKIQLSSELRRLYGLNVHEQSATAPPDAAAIGRWLDQNREGGRYFISITHETRPVQRRVRKNPFFMRNLLQPESDDDFTTVTEQRLIVTGYRSTVDLPYRYLTMFADPKYPNINASGCFIVPIISMTHLRLFWAFTFYESVGWRDRRMVSSLEWLTDERALKDHEKIGLLVDDIGTKFLSYLEAPIRAKWLPQQTVQGTSESISQEAKA